MYNLKIKSKVLVIAGSDAAGGAGIQADIKTITALGSYAMTANGVKTLLNAPYSVNGWKMFPLRIVDHFIPSTFEEAPGQHHYATSPRLFDQNRKKFESSIGPGRPVDDPECS